ncbi:MAG: 50S ribosomal protein L44e [Thermoproteus sp.]|jgi:large subunit ribosomal protein L44e
MRFPKKVMAYCPRCNTYTEHSVSIYHQGKRRELAEGQRRYNRKLKGYGSSPKPKQKRFAKVNKKITLVLTCSKCGYKLHKTLGRMKRVELV